MNMQQVLSVIVFTLFVCILLIASKNCGGGCSLNNNNNNKKSEKYTGNLPITHRWGPYVTYRVPGSGITWNATGNEGAIYGSFNCGLYD